VVVNNRLRSRKGASTGFVPSQVKKKKVSTKYQKLIKVDLV